MYCHRLPKTHSIGATRKLGALRRRCVARGRHRGGRRHRRSLRLLLLLCLGLRLDVLFEMFALGKIVGAGGRRTRSFSSSAFFALIFSWRCSLLPPPPAVSSTLIWRLWNCEWWKRSAFCSAVGELNSANAQPLETGAEGSRALPLAIDLRFEFERPSSALGSARFVSRRTWGVSPHVSAKCFASISAVTSKDILPALERGRTNKHDIFLPGLCLGRSSSNFFRDAVVVKDGACRAFARGGSLALLALFGLWLVGRGSGCIGRRRRLGRLRRFCSRLCSRLRSRLGCRLGRRCKNSLRILARVLALVLLHVGMLLCAKLGRFLLTLGRTRHGVAWTKISCGGKWAELAQSGSFHKQRGARPPIGRRTNTAWSGPHCP